MKKENREKAKLFLNDSGYGVGSNYSTGIVIDLMTEFYEAQQQINKNDCIADVVCSFCEKAPATHGIGKTKTVCGKCWNIVVD